MKELFLTPLQLIEFLIDYLPDIGRRVNIGMDRIAIENAVLESVREAELEALLRQVETAPRASSHGPARSSSPADPQRLGSAESTLLPTEKSAPATDDGTLSGPRYERFVRALIKAFPSKNSLGRMLEYRLGKQLDELAFGDDLEDLAFNLVKRANAGGWTPALINAAIAGQPENPQLLAFLHDRPPLSAAAPLVHRQALEAIVSGGEFVDMPAWLGRMEQLVGQVCRIAVNRGLPGTSIGTGFLVGPDLILTNHHVVDALLRGEVPSSAVRISFDYFGTGPGYDVGLATSYRLAESPMSPVDHEPRKSRLPTDDELDFALLRLSTPAGSQLRGNSGRARGYLHLPSDTASVEERRPLFILQHPGGEPLKMHVDLSRGYNANGTRLMYTTNTLPGSSGSPCFDAQLRLCALHHSRDPSYPPQYNEGIPIEKIVADLGKKGVALPS